MELKLNVWTVSVTVFIALVLSCFIYTEFHFTQEIHIPTTAENTFRFLSNPMVSKELHPLAVDVRILTSRGRDDAGPQHISYEISEKLPIGVHTFTVDTYTHPDSLVIYNYVSPFRGLLFVNTTWIVKPDKSDPEACLLAEQASVRQPWILQYYVRLKVEEAHSILFQKVKQAITGLKSGGFSRKSEDI